MHVSHMETILYILRQILCSALSGGSLVTNMSWGNKIPKLLYRLQDVLSRDA